MTTYQHKINDKLRSMDVNERIKIFSLTKRILEFQENNNINLLDDTNANHTNIFRMSIGDIESNHFINIASVYRDYDIFYELVKVCDKTKKIIKLNKCINDKLQTTENKNIIKKYFNIVCLLNLIKNKILKTKSTEQIKNICQQLEKLDDNVNQQIIAYLNLGQIYNNTNNNNFRYVKIDFNNYYNYINCDINIIYSIINDNKIDAVFNTLHSI